MDKLILLQHQPQLSIAEIHSPNAGRRIHCQKSIRRPNLRPLSGGTQSGDTGGLKQNLADEPARFDAARVDEDTDVAAVIVGEAADLIRSREPAQSTLHRMISQAEDRLRRIGQLVEPLSKD